jgi:hypothetical protein
MALARPCGEQPCLLELALVAGALLVERADPESKMLWSALGTLVVVVALAFAATAEAGNGSAVFRSGFFSYNLADVIAVEIDSTNRRAVALAIEGARRLAKILLETGEHYRRRPRAGSDIRRGSPTAL